MQKTKNNPERKSLQERLEWFNSSQCTSVFVKQLTGNYSDFLTEFFDTDKGVPWRPILEGPGGFTRSDGPKLNMANKQCLATIGDYSTKDKCYICGGRLSEYLFSPECEHLLAIESALCHLWIAKDTKNLEKDLEVKNFIRKEYKWAHTCCNRTKSNRDLIREINTGYYEVDIDEILSLLEDIKTSRAHDCYDLNKDGYANIEDNKPRLIGIFQELVDIINGNIDEIGTDYYPIYMRYRFLSAIADDHFERIISEGSFGGGKKMIGGTKKQEEFLDNVLTSEELDKEINEDIDEIISEVEQNEEDPNYYEPLYERIQTKIIYDEETGKPDITEISFYPYKEFHAFLEKAKKTASIMPPFLPKKSYYSEDGRNKFSVPIGNNPYGTFGIEEKTFIEPLTKKSRIEEPSLKKYKKGGSKKRRTIKKNKNSKRKNRYFQKL